MYVLGRGEHASALVLIVFVCVCDYVSLQPCSQDERAVACLLMSLLCSCLGGSYCAMSDVMTGLE